MIGHVNNVPLFIYCFFLFIFFIYIIISRKVKNQFIHNPILQRKGWTELSQKKRSRERSHHIYIYIYIYIERERERERES